MPQTLDGGQGMPVHSSKKNATASEALNSLPVDADQDITAVAWEEKSKGYRSDEIHCGGGARFGCSGSTRNLRRLPRWFSVGR